MPPFTTTTSPAPRRIPILVDRYAVVRRVGKGGAAGVYLVYDQNLHQWRAAKVLHRRHVESEELRVRFLREARTMARLDHPNVVRVLDVVDQLQPFMVMEYIEGGCVLDWLRAHGPMPPFMAVKVLIDVCKALESTHANRIVHRDVKPHNVLTTLQGSCKLTDYGIAKIAPEDAGFDVDYDRTAEGASMGTDAFMSPEQRRDASKVDERADIYSVGATLFTLCTRKAAVDLCMWSADHPKLEPVPEVLREILLKACHRVPDERYATVGELEAALSAVLWSLPSVQATSPSVVMPLEAVPAKPPETISGEVVHELADLWLDEVDTNHGRPIDEATFGSANGASSLAGGRQALQPPPADFEPSVAESSFSPIAGGIVVAVVVGCLVLGTAVAAGAGALQVGAAARTYAEAEAAYIRALEHDPGLSERLIALGAKVGSLRETWGELGESEDGRSRITLAVRYGQDLSKGYNQVPETADRPRLQAIEDARLEWTATCLAWRRVAETEVGSVAVTVGWADAPGEELVGEDGACRSEGPF